MYSNLANILFETQIDSMKNLISRMDKSKMDNLDPNTANIHTPNSQKSKPKNNQPKNNQHKNNQHENNQHKNSQPTNVELPYEFIDSDAGFNVENDEIPDSLLGLGDDPNYVKS